MATRRGDTRVLVLATLGVLVVGLLIAAAILLITGRAKTPEIKGPVPFGWRLAAGEGQGGRAVRLRGQQRRRRVLDRARGRQARRAQDPKPGVPDCNVSGAGPRTGSRTATASRSAWTSSPATRPGSRAGRRQGRPPGRPQRHHPGPGRLVAGHNARVTGGLIAAIIVATAFNFTNGVQDAADAVATLVATRTGRPVPRSRWPPLFTFLGPLVVGGAVATHDRQDRRRPGYQVVAVVGAGATGALVWNLLSWWRGLPSSSIARVDRRAGRRASVVADGLDAVGWHTVGLVLLALVLSPALGFLTGFVGLRASRRGSLRRARREIERPIGLGALGQLRRARVQPRRERRGEGDGRDRGHARRDGSRHQHERAALGQAPGRDVAHVGTCVGGWRIVRTVGMRIFRLRPVDGMVSQTGSALVVVGATASGRR